MSERILGVVLRFFSRWHRRVCARRGHTVYTRVQCDTIAYVGGTAGAFWCCTECGDSTFVANDAVSPSEGN